MKSLLIGFLAVLLASWISPALAAGGKTIVGYVEMVRIQPGDLMLEARVDTGARNSSLHATNIAYFQRQGAKWVRFTTKDQRGGPVTLERPLLKMVEVPRHMGQVQVRPLISLGICLGKIYKEAPVNLIDRGSLKFPMLIGRTYLKRNFLVDPSATHKAPPVCVGVPR